MFHFLFWLTWFLWLCWFFRFAWLLWSCRLFWSWFLFWCRLKIVDRCQSFLQGLIYCILSLSFFDSSKSLLCQLNQFLLSFLIITQLSCFTFNGFGQACHSFIVVKLRLFWFAWYLWLCWFFWLAWLFWFWIFFRSCLKLIDSS